MPDPLKSLRNSVAADPGLKASISEAKIAKGVTAADELNDVLMRAIERSGVNDDGLLTGKDMARVSAAVYDRPAQYVDFLEAHGNDNGDVVSGFHHVQGDGGTLVFQGRDFIDTVADAIYHYGFKVVNGRYVNEDGAQNETAADVAGWLNYFLNGKNAVLGTKGDDSLGTGDYSGRFRDANREWFYAGDGDDRIYGGDGADRIWGENGADISGGGNGNDRMWGGAGADRLGGDLDDDRIWGGRGADALYGGDGSDQVFGGSGADTVSGGNGNDLMSGGDDGDRMDGSNGNDTMDGGAGKDEMYGGAGNDRMDGGNGNDSMSGSDGNDRLIGKSGNDDISGGAGRDKIIGGAGKDTLNLWESDQVTDVIIFRPGDSGRKASNMDYVENFNEDFDKIDLSAFDELVLKGIDFAGGGQGSVYYDGTYLRIDEDGNRTVDMMIEFRYLSDLSGDNFIF